MYMQQICILFQRTYMPSPFCPFGLKNLVMPILHRCRPIHMLMPKLIAKRPPSLLGASKETRQSSQVFRPHLSPYVGWRTHAKESTKIEYNTKNHKNLYNISPLNVFVKQIQLNIMWCGWGSCQTETLLKWPHTAKKLYRKGGGTNT
jgi:hypothetical protein